MLSNFSIAGGYPLPPLGVGVLPPLELESACLPLAPTFPPRIHEVFRTRGAFSFVVLTTGSFSKLLFDVRVLSFELLAVLTAGQLIFCVEMAMGLAFEDAVSTVEVTVFAVGIAFTTISDEFEDPDKSFKSYSDSCELAMLSCPTLDEERLICASVLKSHSLVGGACDALGIRVLSSSNGRVRDAVEVTLLFGLADSRVAACISVVFCKDPTPPIVLLAGGGEVTTKSKLSSVELMDALMLKFELSIESMLLLLMDEQQLSSSRPPPDMNRFTSRSGLSMLVDDSTESCRVLLLLLLCWC